MTQLERLAKAFMDDTRGLEDKIGDYIESAYQLGRTMEGVLERAMPPFALPPEVCICAAVIAADGRIFRGHRHDDAMAVAGKAGCEVSSLQGAQGFVTSRGRYVNRREAMQLQRAAGARSCYSHDGVLRGVILFSEDLY